VVEETVSRSKIKSQSVEEAGLPSRAVFRRLIPGGKRLGVMEIKWGHLDLVGGEGKRFREMLTYLSSIE